MNQFQKKIFFIVSLAALFFFFYFRLQPIFLQTVPYTYDQGRDFLKAQEIIRDKDITFIGPTTGIMGLFHGAWWYYYLAFVYLIFGGWPFGFYLAMVFVTSLSVLFFYLFLKKEFGWEISLLFLTLAAVSPYFIRFSFFVSNNFMAPIFVLLFLFALYRFFQRKKRSDLFLIGLSLGFIFEFELALGLFLIPVFVIVSSFFKEFRKKALHIKEVSYFVFGLIIPLLPRVFFELKNNFLQTTAFFNYLQNPSSTNPLTFQEALVDRMKLFAEFFVSIFPANNIAFSLLFLAIALAGLTWGFKKLSSFQKKYVFFVGGLLVFLFFVTLFTRNNFFWPNYLEGLPFFFVMLLLLGFFALTKQTHPVIKNVPMLGILLLLLVGSVSFSSYINQANSKEIVGIKEQLLTVDYVTQKAEGQEFCVKTYTPQLIPYTYNYLFEYYAKKGQSKKPRETFVDNKCFYVLEKNICTFPKNAMDKQKECEMKAENWKRYNLPKGSLFLEKKSISKMVSIELWEKK